MTTEGPPRAPAAPPVRRSASPPRPLDVAPEGERPLTDRAPRAGAPWRAAVRRVMLLTALLVGLGAWATVDRAMGREARIEEAALHGVPDRPSGWARVRAGLFGAPTVGVQIGHLHAHAHPDELASLRVSTGADVDGEREVDVNAAVAEALARRLAAAGVTVQLLPATVPAGYRADLVVSLHADASPDRSRSGYKSAHREPARSVREPMLRRTVDAAYLKASGMRHDEANVTGAMLHYYAFSDRRFRHAVARGTPGLIIEMGYLSHPGDRAWLGEPDRPAAALADGIVRYLAAIDRWHPALADDGAERASVVPVR
ncbi:MAG: N-acetylmuramoyl-L-alanine amidase [Trueperaceae bacterium]